jgi:signal transduction histidine kinase
MVIAIALTALGVMFVSKWAADTASKRASLKRLLSTGDLCTNAAYPLTPSVLTQIQDLSGLVVAIYSDSDGSEALTLQASSSRFPTSMPPRLVANLAKQDPVLQQIILNPEGKLNAICISIPESNSSKRSRILVLLENALDSQAASVQSFVLPLATGIFASLAIAMIAGMVANRIGWRIESLDAHVRSIADGTFRLETPQGPVDAIHSLHQSVNSMSLQLERSMGQIVKAERTRLINLMASGLSHELRNRLTGARLAVQTCQSTGDFEVGLPIALKQMQLAEETIQRLLTISTSKTDRSEPALSALQIVDAVAQLTRPIAMHQNVDFGISPQVSEGKTSYEFDCDRVLIGRGASVVSALINLVLNAIEAAGPGGKVSLWMQKVPFGEISMLRWIVIDDGQGPTQNVAEAMFEPFFTTKREGVGLGLAMSKQVAEGQQGTLSWERHEGTTRFMMDVRPISWE